MLDMLKLDGGLKAESLLEVGLLDLFVSEAHEKLPNSKSTSLDPPRKGLTHGHALPPVGCGVEVHVG